MSAGKLDQLIHSRHCGVKLCIHRSYVYSFLDAFGVPLCESLSSRTRNFLRTVRIDYIAVDRIVSYRIYICTCKLYTFDISLGFRRGFSLTAPYGASYFLWLFFSFDETLKDFDRFISAGWIKYLSLIWGGTLVRVRRQEVRNSKP